MTKKAETHNWSRWPGAYAEWRKLLERAFDDVNALGALSDSQVEALSRIGARAILRALGRSCKEGLSLPPDGRVVFCSKLFGHPGNCEGVDL